MNIFAENNSGIAQVDSIAKPDWRFVMRHLTPKELEERTAAGEKLNLETIRRGYRFKLEAPTTEQVNFFNQAFGNERFAWNHLLNKQFELLKGEAPLMSAFDMNNYLTDLKQELEFLKLSPSQSLQVCAAKLSNSFAAWFDKTNPAKRPTFQKKGDCRESITYPQGVKLVEIDQAYIPKIGKLTFKNGTGLPIFPTPERVSTRYRRRPSAKKSEREIQGVIKNVAISRKGGDYFISFQTELVVEKQLHPSKSATGADVGAVRYISLTSGEFALSLNALERKRTRLAFLQKNLARCTKGSKNHAETKAAIAKLHKRIANMREDFQHKLSTDLCNSHAVIFVEDLNVKSMMASAAGTVENPGKNVRQKSDLNRAIADQAWSEFKRMLKYKLAWRGGFLIEVAPQFTSQECPHCSHISPDNRKTQAKFACVLCGFEGNADHVAAINIYNRGMALVLSSNKNVKGLTSPDSLEVLRSLLATHNQELESFYAS